VDMKKLAAGTATASLLGLGGLGLAFGQAQADPHATPVPPTPANPGTTTTTVPAPPTVTGPGVNSGAPGNPLPPGLGYLPPPGHGGPMPQDRVAFPSTPSWVISPVEPPAGAPAQPAVPSWATGLPVVWSPDLNTWGVWDAAGNAFIPI
jgi:hypothetical protein